MRRGQRAKLTAGAGLATMLLGALMVLVPTGAGATSTEPPGQSPEAECLEAFTWLVEQGKLDAVPAAYAGAKWEGNPDYTWMLPNGGTYNGFSALAQATKQVGSVLVEYKEATHDVYVAIVKQAGLDKTVIELDGERLGSFVYTGDDDLSHFSLCSYTPDDPTGTLIVRKDVVPDPVEADPSFDFTVNGPAEYSDSFSLGDGDSDSSEVPAGIGYTIGETDPGPDYELDGVECTIDDGNPFSPTITGGSVTVDVADDSIVDCTFTNVPVEEEGRPELTVEKRVQGGTAPAEWAFDFSLCGEPQDEVVTAAVAEVDCLFTLGNSGELETSETFSGASFEVTELDDENPSSTLSSIVCTDDSGATVGTVDLPNATVSVDLDESDVTCVFTNTWPTPQIPPPPQVTPSPASLTVVKAVTGAVPDAWEFTFGLEDVDGNELFVLDQSDDDETFSLPAGAYELTEYDVSDDAANLTGVECVDASGAEIGDLDGGVVSLALASAASVTCTYTNDFVEVEGEGETPTTTTTEPEGTTTTTTTTQPAQAVLGAQVTRTLPRTGNETRDLAGLGAALIGLGAALLVASRRRQGLIS